jgi:PPM family protein phosphatase
MNIDWIVMVCEKRGTAAVAWLPGTAHKYYEDRYRLLPREVALVGRQNRGELFAVFDGIGGAPKGRQAAQEMSDWLVRFYQHPLLYPGSCEGLYQLLMEANLAIFDWGLMPGTNTPLGGCAGTIAWLFDQDLLLYHAGDTTGILMRDDECSLLTRAHEKGNVMYRYFGLGPTLEIEFSQTAVEELDRILLISDGVTKAFDPLQAADLVNTHSDICRAATDLANRSRALGSQDDITVLLIEVDSE